MIEYLAQFATSGTTLVISLLTIFTGAIAILQWLEQRHEGRVERLKKVRSSITLERFRYSDECLRYYEDAFKESPDRHSDLVLYKDGWICTPGEKGFPRLADVSVNVVDEWDSDRNPVFRDLPVPKDRYAENAKFYAEVPLSNRPLFGLLGVSADDTGNVTLDIRKGYYYDFYNTCEILSLEMAYIHRIKRQSQFNTKQLKLRNEVRDVFDLDNRFVGIGINVLTILKNVELENGTKSDFFLLHKRSAKNVAEGANSYHVVPAGSFQPTAMIMPKVLNEFDLSPVNTVIREFYEELMGYEEFSDLFNANLLSDTEKELDVHYIGVALDPLNTKAEVLAYMTIDVSDRTFSLFEGKRTKEELDKFWKDNHEGKVKLRPMNRSMLKQFKDNPSSIPAFRKILDVVLENEEFFGVKS